MKPAQKARRRARRKYAKPKGETYVFRLFVAGNESNSLQARRNLARLCEEHVKGPTKSRSWTYWKTPLRLTTIKCW